MLPSSKSVFDLVMFVIAIMGAGFAPLMIVRIMRWELTEMLALAMVAGGLAVAVWWRLEGFHKAVFDTFPGMIAALGIYGMGRLFMITKQSLYPGQETES